MIILCSVAVAAALSLAFGENAAEAASVAFLLSAIAQTGFDDAMSLE